MEEGACLCRRLSQHSPSKRTPSDQSNLTERYCTKVETGSENKKKEGLRFFFFFFFFFFLKGRVESISFSPCLEFHKENRKTHLLRRRFAQFERELVDNGQCQKTHTHTYTQPFTRCTLMVSKSRRSFF